MLKLTIFLSAVLALFINCTGPASEKQVVQKTTPSPTPTKDELRLKTEEQMLKGENHHDGSSILESVGTLESVPALLRVLEDNPPSPDGTMVCTAGHANDALKKITAANPGYTFKAWKSWWDKQKKNSNQPPNSNSQ